LSKDSAHEGRLGATYIQIDAPHYALLLAPETRTFYEARGWTLEEALVPQWERSSMLFAGAAGLRGAALPAGRLLIDLIRRDIDLTMEFTDSVAPGPNDHGRRCRRKPGNLRAARGFPVTG
jgi:hypothetical protein